MGGYWVNLGLVGVLVVLNAVFAGSEIALISLREGQLRQLERRGSPDDACAAALRAVRGPTTPVRRDVLPAR